MCKDKLFIFWVLLVFSVVIPGGADANMITVATPVGATELGGNPVNAQAVITTSQDAITITLANLFVNPTTVAQNLSGLFFTLAPGLTGTISSSSGEVLSKSV